VARQPKLRKKHLGKSTYWFTKAGGDTHLGNVEEVTHRDARKLFAAHLLKLRTEESSCKRKRLSAGELIAAD
jgi:hypothetical protein